MFTSQTTDGVAEPK